MFKQILNIDKGITLIALVITIIILLILAGITIGLVAGDNGILTQAGRAQEKTVQAQEEENIKLAVMAAIGESLGGDIEQGDLEKELDVYFGGDGYQITTGENNGEDGYIVTIEESGNQYFVDKDGNVSQMIKGPSVTHTISPEEQVAEGDKITITITATATEGSITEIIKPDGSSVKNVTEATYEVTENGEYKFTVKQSNGGSTTYTVEITTGIEVERFSDIYTETKEYTKDGETAWIPKGFAVGVTSKIDDISEGLVITDKIDENHKSIGNEFVWIPVKSEDEYVRNTTYEDTNASSTAYTDTGYLPEGIQPTTDDATNNENAEREAVVRKGGFYISRYEAGKEGENTLVSKKGATVWNNISQADCKTEAKKFINNENVKSALCSGIQWDVIMEFVDGKLDGENNTIDVTVNEDRGGSSASTSGGHKADRMCNIFDLEENYFEYVAEKNSFTTSAPFVRRGAYCNYTNSASYRNYGDGTAYGDLSFRFTLYVM